MCRPCPYATLQSGGGGGAVEAEVTITYVDDAVRIMAKGGSPR
jgi:hypothetical protein